MYLILGSIGNEPSVAGEQSPVTEFWGTEEQHVDGICAKEERTPDCFTERCLAQVGGPYCCLRVSLPAFALGSERPAGPSRVRPSYPESPYAMHGAGWAGAWRITQHPPLRSVRVAEQTGSPYKQFPPIPEKLGIFPPSPLKSSWSGVIWG